jgi:hypothetical protein
MLWQHSSQPDVDKTNQPGLRVVCSCQFGESFDFDWLSSWHGVVAVEGLDNSEEAWVVTGDASSHRWFQLVEECSPLLVGQNSPVESHLGLLIFSL